MKSLLLFFLAVSFSVNALDCAQAPFMMMGIEALKLGRCQPRLLNNPSLLAISCNRLKSKDLLEAMSINCYGNTKVCQNKNSLEDRAFWLTQIASARIGQLESTSTESEEMKEKMNRQECVEQTALLATLKAYSVLGERARNLGGGIIDVNQENNQKTIPAEIVADCNNMIKDMRTNMKSLLQSRLRFCSLSSNVSQSILKQDICKLIPWSCSIKID